MEKYKLARNPYTGEISDYVMKISDGSIVHKTLNKEYLQDGVELQDAEGQVMTKEQVEEFMRSLP